MAGILSAVLAAIVWIAPYLPERTAKSYARIIVKQATRRKIHPLLPIAFIHVESRWNPKLVSTTNDYGLSQIHVAARGSAKFLGREKELFDPQVNIEEWCRLAAMWRNYHHNKEPESIRHTHPWWAHLKWGYNVKDTSISKSTIWYFILRDHFSSTALESI